MRALALALSLCALALGACSGPRGGAGPAEGASDAQAARLYRARCSACHRPYEPASRTREEWADVVSLMAPRAHLRSEERALILGYLQAHARDAAAR